MSDTVSILRSVLVIRIRTIMLGLISIGCLVHAGPAACEGLSVEVRGVNETVATNVRAQIGLDWISVTRLDSSRRRQEVQSTARRNAAEALRPYGYYDARVRSQLEKNAEGQWQLTLDIVPGPPVTVAQVNLGFKGPGAELDSLQEWRRDWPLSKGTVLNQDIWEQEKDRVLRLVARDGYLSAQFETARIGLDLLRHTADLDLVLDTGPQAVFGTIDFKDNTFRPGVLEYLPLFKTGDPFSADLLEQFRIDLWKTGYFYDIDVREERQLDQTPPSVNLQVSLKKRNPDTYQGTIGYGTDTEARSKFLWSRHLISGRGDSADAALGWQQFDREITLRGNYRLPIPFHVRQFWQAGFELKHRNQSLEVYANDNPDDVITLANGAVQDISFKLGRTHIRDLFHTHQRLNETLFAQYLSESDNYDLPPSLEVFEPPRASSSNFRHTRRAISIGAEWDLPEIRGSGFFTSGHHEQASVFTASKRWGSELNFSQVYVSSKWNFLLGDHWKILLRGEAGYSDAQVNDVQVQAGGESLDLSLTELPHLYRFFAGGGRSVRGYGYEDLSDNGRGSNNVLTGSVEAEYNFRPKWSAAAFFDVGDAFNHWRSRNFHRGAGVGLRWYSVAGVLRLDIAQALDIEGEPWRLHFSIGTPLL